MPLLKAMRKLGIPPKIIGLVRLTIFGSMCQIKVAGNRPGTFRIDSTTVPVSRKIQTPWLNWGSTLDNDVRAGGE
ncbi:hypothetical protein DMENIID0001_006290 [Sergentomyia squamirostris]